MGYRIGFEPIQQLIGAIRDLLGATPLSAQLLDDRGGPLDINNLLLWVRVKPDRVGAVQEHGKRTLQMTQWRGVWKRQVLREAIEIATVRDGG